ncbi:transcriptional regulator, partial [Mycolicibacterium fortuitum]|uniref:helix-turn-helix domain-containing protein n=1 Tax=Mycolicibacterium fortuitum TaxID=1766 RepID=UPI0007EA0310
DVYKRQGLTLDEAAEASSISKPVLSKTERGERAARVTELLPLATAYGVTAEQIVAEIAADPEVRAVGNP